MCGIVLCVTSLHDREKKILQDVSYRDADKVGIALIKLSKIVELTNSLQNQYRSDSSVITLILNGIKFYLNVTPNSQKI